MLGSLLADNSKRTYGRAWQVFQRFHEATFGTTGELPLSPNQVAMFVAYMDRVCQALATVRTYVSALSHAHRMADMADPTTKFWVKKVVDAVGSQANMSSPHKPITLRILHKLVTAAQAEMPEYEAPLMRAIVSMAFHACARIGEIVCSNGQPQHAMLAQNVIVGPVQVAVTFISFKHHKGRAPVTRVLQAASK